MFPTLKTFQINFNQGQPIMMTNIVRAAPFSLELPVSTFPRPFTFARPCWPQKLFTAWMCRANRFWSQLRLVSAYLQEFFVTSRFRPGQKPQAPKRQKATGRGRWHNRQSVSIIIRAQGEGSPARGKKKGRHRSQDPGTRKPEPEVGADT